MSFKLKEKLEEQPKYIVEQTKLHSLPIWIFDLNPYVDSNLICDYIIQNKANLKYNHDWPEAGDIFHNLHTNLLLPNENENPEFKKLFLTASDKVAKIWNKINPFQQNYTFLLTHYLLAIYYNNDSIDWHDHGITDLGAAYYGRVPTNSSNIIFENSPTNLEIEVKTGMLVIFPGNARHKVNKSNHEGERIVVTMNFWKDKLFK